MSIVVHKGWPQYFRMIPHSRIPPELQDRYRPNEPVIQTTSDFECSWTAPDGRVARIVVESGLIFDGASIHWTARSVGLSRWSPDLWQVIGAITHDPAYQGLARFPDTRRRENRRLHDLLARDLWLYAGGPRWQVRAKYLGLRLGGWKAYEREPLKTETNRAYIRWEKL